MIKTWFLSCLCLCSVVTIHYVNPGYIKCLFRTQQLAFSISLRHSIALHIRIVIVKQSRFDSFGLTQTLQNNVFTNLCSFNVPSLALFSFVPLSKLKLCLLHLSTPIEGLVKKWVMNESGRKTLECAEMDLWTYLIYCIYMQLKVCLSLIRFLYFTLYRKDTSVDFRMIVYFRTFFFL